MVAHQHCCRYAKHDCKLWATCPAGAAPERAGSGGLGEAGGGAGGGVGVGAGGPQALPADHDWKPAGVLLYETQVRG